MAAFSLEDLNRRIAQRERELEALRQELESRRDQLTALTHRKGELIGQLRQVESEIAALTASPPSTAEQSKRTPPTAPSPGTPAKYRPKLGDSILAALQEGGKAMTARQLSEALRRRGFPLSSRNPVKSVESRLQEMKQQRLVRRAAGQPGYVPVASTHGAKTAESKKTPLAPKQKAKSAAKPIMPAPNSKTPQPGQKGKQPSLREALINVLKSSRKLHSGSALAKLVLASGYETRNTKFVEAVWSMLGQMDNVEHVKGKGYRLKKE